MRVRAITVLYATFKYGFKMGMCKYMCGGWGGACQILATQGRQEGVVGKGVLLGQDAHLICLLTEREGWNF